MNLQEDFAETAEFDVNGKRSKSLDRDKTRNGNRRQPEGGRGIRSSESGHSLKVDEDRLDGRKRENTPQKSNIGDSHHTSNKMEEVKSLDRNGRGKVCVR